jgi:cellulose 1,4-beta-cellobiosidase
LRITQPQLRRRGVWLLRMLAGSIGACAAVAGCSDGVPLGGPHGAQTNAVVEPNAGNSSSSSVSRSTSTGSTSSGSSGAGSSTASSSGSGSGGTDGGAATGSGPTFTAIFSAYMADCKSCHTQTTSAKSTYLWLRSQGYITGTSPALVSSSQSCLSWYGGNMPPGGGDNAAAVADMNAWASGGALNN